MVFLNSECKYFFALMRLTDCFLSISHSFQTQMRQKPFFSYILSTYQHILILSCRQFLRFSLFSACAISDKEVPMKKEKHSDISSRKKSNQKIIDSYDYLSNAASAQDCTGLIPVGPTNRAELESYEEVYHYRPPKIDPKKCE